LRSIWLQVSKSRFIERRPLPIFHQDPHRPAVIPRRVGGRNAVIEPHLLGLLDGIATLFRVAELNEQGPQPAGFLLLLLLFLPLHKRKKARRGGEPGRADETGGALITPRKLLINRTVAGTE